MRVEAQKPGLYVHIPFCSSVCPYCDFAVVIAGDQRRSAFVEALGIEAGLIRTRFAAFDTVYFGGGTPSSLDVEQLGEIIEMLRRTLPIDENARFYLEANPEDVNSKRAQSWRYLGFETVSLGVQSFDDRILDDLGRRHDSDCAIRAVDTLKCAGFATVSIDLIYGMKGIDLAGWRRQIDQAVSLEVDHLSCYQLTIHQGTVFGRRFDRGELEIASDNAQGDFFLATHRWLGNAGFDGYEVSNFAADVSHRSLHNLKYWDHTEYLGLGPSAHSFSGHQRWWNRKKVRLWQHDVLSGEQPIEGSEDLGDADFVLESIMLGLRTRSGVDFAEIENRFGIDLVETNLRLIEEVVESALGEFDGRRLRLTTKGFAVVDGLVQKFVIRR